jgi:hypothetical protein
MFEEAVYNKQQLVTAFDTEDSAHLAQTKRDIRKADWPSCFDNIVFEEEASDEADVAPEPEKVHAPAPVTVALIASVTTKRASVTFASELPTIHEIAVEEDAVSAATANPAIAHLELKFCWVCDKAMNMCKC